MSDQHVAAPPADRRRFLQWCTHGLGALWASLFSIPIIAYLIDARHREARERDFKTVGRLSGLKQNKPEQAVVRDSRRDAWTLHPNDVIGRVWLIRREGNAVEAYTTICPHLGCSINYEENSKRFICPCHMGTWDNRCKLVPSAELGRENAPPRDMDALDVRFDPADPDAIQVRYQTFEKGVHEKKAVS
jgi:Rieske Fe-S protein